MTRNSNKARIVAGALAVIAADGVAGLTFEAVAQQVGLSRGGVVYHFSTREALLEGIAGHLLDSWREQALDELGKPVEQASAGERIAAVARSVLNGAILPGELAFMLSGRPEAEGLSKAWDEFYDEWVGDQASLTPVQQVALLAIDGFWSNAATGATSRNPDDERVLRLVVDLASGARPEIG